MAFPYKKALVKKKKEVDESLKVQASSLSVLFEPPTEDVKSQLTMLQFTVDDLKIMKALQPIVSKHLDEVTEHFYQVITQQPSLLNMIEANSEVEHLKQLLKTHVSELFAGEISAEFIEKRIRIAQAHVRIGLQNKWYLAAFQHLHNCLIACLEQEIHHPEDLLLAVKVIGKFSA